MCYAARTLQPARETQLRVTVFDVVRNAFMATPSSHRAETAGTTSLLSDKCCYSASALALPITAYRYLLTAVLPNGIRLSRSL